MIFINRKIKGLKRANIKISSLWERKTFIKGWSEELFKTIRGLTFNILEIRFSLKMG